MKRPLRACSLNVANEFDPLKIVVIIKSAPHNYEKRQNFRKIYSFLKRNPFKQYGIAIVFSVGMPRSIASREFKISKNVSLVLPGANGDALTADALNATRLKLAKEMAEHDDLIVGAYEDTYYNLTLKLMHSYYWFSYFCHKSQPTLISMDDDMGFNISYIDNFLASMQTSTRLNLFAGMQKLRGPVVRLSNANLGNLWGETKAEMPWSVYPPLVSIVCYYLLTTATSLFTLSCFYW